MHLGKLTAYRHHKTYFGWDNIMPTGTRFIKCLQAALKNYIEEELNAYRRNYFTNHNYKKRAAIRQHGKYHGNE